MADNGRRTPRDNAQGPLRGVEGEENCFVDTCQAHMLHSSCHSKCKAQRVSTRSSCAPSPPCKCVSQVRFQLRRGCSPHLMQALFHNYSARSLGMRLTEASSDPCPGADFSAADEGLGYASICCAGAAIATAVGAKGGG